ncbi:MAG: AMP-binding protein [Candidatus Krumholzibacteria bacterium]|nr:AMP-binding protein [Candidatus Krumholzibacteria bacterium]
MVSLPDTDTLLGAGASAEQAQIIQNRLQAVSEGTSDAETWFDLTRSVLDGSIPFAVHQIVFKTVFADWDHSQGPPPAWRPTPEDVDRSNITALCRQTGHSSFEDLFAWSLGARDEFWQAMIDALQIRFGQKPKSVVDLSEGPEFARWLPGARLNIIDSCFNAPPEQVAVVHQAEGGELQKVTYAELDRLSNRVANSLVISGIKAGEAIAIDMQMTYEAVASYIGIVKAGCVVVSIADSFAADEIATRLRISGAKTVVTQDVLIRAGKTLPMYQKVIDAGAERTIVIPAEVANGGTGGSPVSLRECDAWWSDFLVEDDQFDARQCEPDDTINVLFSSGTTGDPKAIPWTHTSPIKCAMDGFLHQDIHPGDVVAWPTNLGWMMGPWLIFASLVNRATMALYYGSPVSREFCEFVHKAGVTMLGLVPAVVRAWKAAEVVHGLDWSRIKVFSSTGEPSNPDDYLFLMSLAGYRPVIEYCGGTEISGGYISGTVVQPASPSTFSTPSFGLGFYILDEEARQTDVGELFLIPPSIGLSSRLLNKDHHEVYYEGTPTGPNAELLRRHGDEKQRLPGDYYRALGRADDTMNLGGIKVSSADIERVVSFVDGVSETAAISVTPKRGGPSQLVVYAVTKPGIELDRFGLRIAMQRAISSGLNPLFKVHDVVVTDSLPRTASHKVMRRVLRKEYEAGNDR